MVRLGSDESVLYLGGRAGQARTNLMMKHQEDVTPSIHDAVKYSRRQLR